MNPDNKYLHLLAYRLDHNGNSSSLRPVVIYGRHSEPPLVFPKKGKQKVITERYFNDKGVPRTVTTKINCCGLRHEITLTSAGEIHLHNHSNLDELRAMSFFGDEKTRCLQIVETWEKMFRPNEWWDIPELKKILPRQFHPIANLLWRSKSSHRGGLFTGSTITNIRKAHKSFTREPRGRTLQEKVAARKEKILVDYFGGTGFARFAKYQFPEVQRWHLDSVISETAWWERVRGVGLHKADFHPDLVSELSEPERWQKNRTGVLAEGNPASLRILDAQPSSPAYSGLGIQVLLVSQDFICAPMWARAIRRGDGWLVVPFNSSLYSS